ncbi:hypothetical protein [Amycolatopsis sp. NPDC059021]|uniref:hypothetical protein n=1 Tax=Amycolatopsis sp. NPDC059021 TaxID=3346704 RepID=UPI00366C9F4C
MDREEALSRLRDAVASWYVDLGGTAEIAYAACDVVAAGIDGPAIVALAAVSVRAADVEVPWLLDDALREAGLTPRRKGTPGANEEGLRVVARRTVAGSMTPRECTRWVFGRFGTYTNDLADVLAGLDDYYDALDFIPETREEVDALVLAEARRLAMG